MLGVSVRDFGNVYLYQRLTDECVNVRERESKVLSPFIFNFLFLSLPSFN